jgi:hypothetical protein
VREWWSNPSVRVGTLAGVGGVVLGLIIGFCAGGSGDAEPVALPDTTVPGTEGSTTTTTTVAEPSDEATTTSTTEPAAEPVDRNPLTGEELAEPVVRRIVSIKVDNVAAAQPQIGLNEAEMLFEVPVEGGITRFTALYFEAAPPVVGPVRSIREVDAALLAPFTPLLLTSGGQDFVTRQFEAVGISVIDQNAEGLFGIIDRPQPHHVVALLELIDRVAGDSGSSMGGFSFGDGFAPTGGATAISIPFSGVADVSWRFEDGQWVRSQNGETAEVLPTFDGSPEPMVTDTVVVLKVAQRSAGYTDSAGAQVLNFDVVGFGDAMVFHDGGVVEGRWLRSAQEDPWVIVDGDGREVPLPIGRVFVEIVPRFVEVTFQ